MQFLYFKLKLCTSKSFEIASPSLSFNPITLRMAKTPESFGHSESNMVKNLNCELFFSFILEDME